MKRIILIIMILMVSCQGDVRLNGNATGIKTQFDMNLLEIQLDSCTYIVHGLRADNGLLTHKGNCKNCRKWQRENIYQCLKEFQSISPSSSIDTLKIIQDILRSRLR